MTYLLLKHNDLLGDYPTHIPQLGDSTRGARVKVDGDTAASERGHFVQASRVHNSLLE